MNLQLFSEGGRKDRLRSTADDESEKIEPLSGLRGCEGRGQKEMLCYEKVWKSFLMDFKRYFSNVSILSCSEIDAFLPQLIS